MQHASDVSSFLARFGIGESPPCESSSQSSGLFVDTAHRIARRFRSSSKNPTLPIPKLTVTQDRSAMPPTAWFICPDFNSPSGGIRKIYRCVDILTGAGLQAAIMHTRPGFRCDWFEHATPIVSSTRAAVKRDDVIVVPEIYGGNIRKLPPNVRQVIFNQNVYITLNTLAEGMTNAAPYLNNPELASILVVSQDNVDVIRYIFPDAPVHRLRLGIDLSIYHPPTSPKQRRIAYMPRKRPRDAALVLELLRQRGILEDWDVVAIEGRSEAEAAELLRSAKIFLSFSSMEGFGLPPLEALACGCCVVGYHGFGGREYFQPPFATAVEEGNIVAFVRAVEAAVRRVDSGHQVNDSFAASASRFVFERYSLEAERQDVLDVFVPLLR
jgi:hypothetical protein